MSYRLAVPTRTPLSLKTVNGGITVGTVDSRVDIRTTNGGVKLSHMAGDVEGQGRHGEQMVRGVETGPLPHGGQEVRQGAVGDLEAAAGRAEALKKSEKISRRI